MFGPIRDEISSILDSFTQLDVPIATAANGINKKKYLLVTVVFGVIVPRCWLQVNLIS